MSLAPVAARCGILPEPPYFVKFVHTQEQDRSASGTSRSSAKQRLQNAAPPHPSVRSSPMRIRIHTAQKRHPASFQPNSATELLPSGSPLTPCRSGRVADKLREYSVPA